MSGQQKGELARKVDLCIDKYASAHKGKFPNIAVVTPQVYDLLNQAGLILPPITLNQQKDNLRNRYQEPIEVYKTDDEELPDDIKIEVEESKMRFPLYLYRTNFEEYIKRKSGKSFDLEATTEALSSFP